MLSQSNINDVIGAAVFSCAVALTGFAPATAQFRIDSEVHNRLDSRATPYTGQPRWPGDDGSVYRYGDSPLQDDVGEVVEQEWQWRDPRGFGIRDPFWDYGFRSPTRGRDDFVPLDPRFRYRDPAFVREFYDYRGLDLRYPYWDARRYGEPQQYPYYSPLYYDLQVPLTPQSNPNASFPGMGRPWPRVEIRSGNAPPLRWQSDVGRDGDDRATPRRNSEGETSHWIRVMYDRNNDGELDAASFVHAADLERARSASRLRMQQAEAPDGRWFEEPTNWRGGSLSRR